MYVIIGATGNTGKPVTSALLEAGKTVRAISRNKEHLQDLVRKGAEPWEGDILDTDFLRRAFDGAEAAYLMIPPDMSAEKVSEYQRRVAKSLVTAVREANVKYAVALSSMGAELEEDLGIVQGLHELEKYLNELKDTNVLILRAGYFMRNLYSQIGIIKKTGTAGSPLRGDLKIPLVATADIGARAAHHLLNLDFKGKSVEYVLGPRDISYSEITRVLGKAIGREDLRYVQFPYEESKKSMVQMGMSESAASAMVEFTRRMNGGDVLAGVHRDKTSSTPTGIDDFAPIFARAYREE